MNTEYSDQDRHNDDSSISTKLVFHNKRQSLVAEALPASSGQTDKDITPLLKAAPPSKT